MKVAQVVVNSYTDVATDTETLLGTLSISTLNAIIIKNFGADKWLVVVVYTE